jgi:outer membrane protein
LSDAERQTRQRTLDEKEKSLQRNVEDARNDFSGEMNEKFSGIAQKVAAVMTKYAQQNGYTLVLDAGSQQQQSPILWAAESTNISEAVVQAYNQQSGVPPQPNAAAAPRTGATPTRTTPRTTTPTPRTQH